MTKQLPSAAKAGLLGTLSDPREISAPAARAAHLHLLEATARMNLRAEPGRSAVTAIKLYDHQNRYLFSWIINAHHLLFYLRKPALKMLPGLAASAQRQLAGVKINPAGEVTIRLENLQEAEVLSAWLFNPETWSSGSDRTALSDGILTR